jgi:hypothetical protein
MLTRGSVNVECIAGEFPSSLDAKVIEGNRPRGHHRGGRR